MSRLPLLLACGILFLNVDLSLGQTVIYVDDDAPLGGDGMGGDTAFSDLLDALDVAVAD